jgi:hypothetical protein
MILLKQNDTQDSRNLSRSKTLKKNYNQSAWLYKNRRKTEM